MNAKLLRIYLNDHLAGATAGLELAKRSLASNRGTPLGDFLEGLAAEIEDDRQALKRVMDALGLPQSSTKQSLALIAERVGRLKLNGQLRGYSDLSRLVELESLRIGVEGKLALWRSLKQTLPGERTVPVDLDALIERAERQRDGLERYRLEAARTAFTGERATTSS